MVYIQIKIKMTDKELEKGDRIKSLIYQLGEELDPENDTLLVILSHDDELGVVVAGKKYLILASMIAARQKDKEVEELFQDLKTIEGDKKLQEET